MSEQLSSIDSGKIRVRIAPSPTGFLHIGTARSALFNFLYAKSRQGSFVLRIEDTDLERSSLEFEKDIIENLKWLGIDWSEGPEKDGPYGPYKQSQRAEIYQGYIQKLLDLDKAYYCFCSEDELEAQRQDQMSRGAAPKYSGKCAGLSKETVAKYLAEGRPSVIRFRLPARKVSFEDLIRRKVEFDVGLMGDLVIAKNLTTPLYNLAVVIDDYEMKISHVIRGEDHISNTPKQILLQEALGFSRPIYAHLPLILGPDRTKLSKRHGSTAVSEFRKEGYLPETLINFMAFLGWSPGDEKEIYSMASLIKEFSLDRVQKSGAIFNIKKLDYLNGFYIRRKSIEKLTEMCLPYLIGAGFIDKEEFNFDEIKKIARLYQDRMKKLSEIADLTDYFFKARLAYPKELLVWRDSTAEETKKVFEVLENILERINIDEWKKEKLEETLLREAERMGLSAEAPSKAGDRGRILWPLRVALSGKQASAGPIEIAEALGKEKTLQRIKEAKKLLQRQ